MEPRDADRLDSWREIAAFIDRDERTAMRWVKQYGMPVHHAPGGSHARVYAFRSEVLAWVQLQDHANKISPHSVPATSGNAGPPSRPVSRTFHPEPVLIPAPSFPETVKPHSSLLLRFTRRKLFFVAGAALLTVLLLLAALFALR